jgi:hypothetical protein
MKNSSVIVAQNNNYFIFAPDYGVVAQLVRASDS